ncbi:hypothetical protein RFI_34075 [Reticulomyxa filosa]|uniref:Uncharacterized protein n=1 Tax=Reticulomyxa filosa TaxID=46433 RepID=X6LNZ1_RETFI|nr:hypothetical protein RFI_34075 [Reticulomyxa filosa]|eukprot:ETO03334.1 hypothetical protein RFI_34075 [Reticulomyxa filosa]
MIEGGKKCYQGVLVLIVKDIISQAENEVMDEFQNKIEQVRQQSQMQKNDAGDADCNFFLIKMYKGILVLDCCANNRYKTKQYR